MRASLFTLILAALPAGAGQTLGTLNADTVLRGGPKADAADAGRIAAGSTVVIHHDEGDWYALQAPRGCVSWISHLFVEFPDKNGAFPKNAVVRSEGDVKLAVGRAGHGQPLDARKTVVPDGTLVLVIGPAVKNDADKSTWYPIIPPEDDFRYVPKTSITLSSQSPGGFVVKSPVTATATPAMSPSPAAIAAGPPSGKAHPLWMQAEEAERGGDFDRAERLYFQLAREMNGPGGDSDLANACYSRVHAIRERRRNGQAAPANNNSWNTATKPEVKGTGVATVAASQPADLPLASTEKREPVAEKPAAEKIDAKGQWSGSGYLRIAGFKIGGKQAYALEDSRGRLLYYATANGVELDKYRNKSIDLFGMVSNPKDLRGVALIDVTKIDSVR